MQKLYKYYIEEAYNSKLHTAAVVRKDNEIILAAEGFIPLKFKHTKDGSFIIKILRLINAVSITLACKKKSIVVFHFPLLANVYALLHKFLQWRGAKTIALVIDIDGLRYSDDNKLSTELSQLKKFTYIIAHNDVMKNFLQANIPGATILTINLFDYPASEKIKEKTLSKTICIAANHDKGKYVYQLNQLIPLYFNLYGEGYDEKQQASNISYKGIFAPAILPSVIEGSFGLIWDGLSLIDCDRYLAYNNPHKLSLYISAGMPVIVWKQSAVAKFVIDNNIGITVQALTELTTVVSSISESSYEKMKQNVNVLKEKVNQGWYLKEVISKINTETNGV